MTEKYLLIPVEYAAHALSTNQEPAHHLFLLLKSSLPGYGYISTKEINKLSSHLDRSTRTVRRYLDKLLEWNYIGKDHYKNLFIIRSWKRIRENIDFEYAWAVEWNVYKIEDAQAFFAGIVIGRLAHQNYLKKKKTESEPAQLKSQCAYPGSTSSHILQPVADRALVQILGISKGKANKLKHKAQSKGYINLQSNLKPLLHNTLLHTSEKTTNESFRMGVKNRTLDRKLLSKMYSEFEGKIRIDKVGKISLMESHLVRPNLLYKKGRNM